MDMSSLGMTYFCIVLLVEDRDGVSVNINTIRQVMDLLVLLRVNKHCLHTLVKEDSVDHAKLHRGGATTMFSTVCGDRVSLFIGQYVMNSLDPFEPDQLLPVLLFNTETFASLFLYDPLVISRTGGNLLFTHHR